jgi:ribonuclease BN (tRNA processing enzyme)
MLLIPLGVGEAFTATYYTSCLAVGSGDDWMLIDCPHPVRKMLRDGSTAAGIPLDLDRIGLVAVSHLHADHCCGLEDFGYFSTCMLGRRGRLAAHPEVSSRLWSGLLSAGMEWVWEHPGSGPIRKEFSDYFELIDLDPNRPVQCGPFAIECRKTIHGVPTTAFRIEAGGRVLGFSADTAFDPGLIEWLEPAHLIVHEATTTVHTGTHTPYEKLLQLPPSVRDRMRLIHYPDPDRFDVSTSQIEPLRQGRCYRV